MSLGHISRQMLEDAMSRFHGEILQTPPNLPLQQVTASVSLAVKQFTCKPDQSPPSHAEVKNE